MQSVALDKIMKMIGGLTKMLRSVHRCHGIRYPNQYSEEEVRQKRSERLWMTATNEGPLWFLSNLNIKTSEGAVLLHVHKFIPVSFDELESEPPSSQSLTTRNHSPLACLVEYWDFCSGDSGWSWRFSYSQLSLKKGIRQCNDWHTSHPFPWLWIA